MDFSANFWDILLWSFWVFIWMSAIFIWVWLLFDLFRDSSLSAWGKVAWAALLIFVPWVGALIYLIARGQGMADRQAAEAQQQQAAQEQYIQSVAGGSPSATAQLTSAKALLDSGAITQSEFDTLKAKALA